MEERRVVVQTVVLSLFPQTYSARQIFRLGRKGSGTGKDSREGAADADGIQMMVLLFV